MDLREAIRTTGSVRRFTDEAVDDATVHALLDDARFAPSGGNRQGWRVVVVKDRDVRAELRDLIQPVWDEYVAVGATGRTPFNSVDESSTPEGLVVTPSVHNDVIEQFLDIPVVLVVAADLTQVAMMDRDLARPAITGGGSIYPFCWNVLLAARSRGLGGVLTTFLARAEPLAAPILHLPPTFAIAAVICVGHPVHQPTRLKRSPVEAFATVDAFDGAPFGVDR